MILYELGNLEFYSTVLFDSLDIFNVSALFAG